MRTIDRVRRGLNQNLALQGVVLTMFDGRNNLCEMVDADVRSSLGDRVHKPMIPRHVRVSEQPSHGKPVLLCELRCAGSPTYIPPAREIPHLENTLPGQQALASRDDHGFRAKVPARKP